MNKERGGMMLGRFKGEDGSRGFIKNVTYTIEVYIDGNWIWLKHKHGPESCPYSTVAKVLENWEINHRGLINELNRSAKNKQLITKAYLW